MQGYFNRVADRLKSLVEGGEEFTCSYSAEDSDFVRFNHNEIRQAGAVSQKVLTVDLIAGRKHAAGALTLSGDLDTDGAGLARLVGDLRAQREFLPEDPYLNIATGVNSGERFVENRVPEAKQAISEIRAAGEGKDLVGIYGAGGIHSGFANSFGQRNWFSTFSYNFDWSFYHEKDKAVKTSYSGFEWKPEEFTRKVAWAGDQLGVLRHTPKTIRPGRYRVYLAPAALDDLVGILSWGGFGLKAHKTKMTPLLKLMTGEKRLSPSVSILENTKEGIAPNFQEAGFLKPDRVPLVEGGTYKDCLISPRSAREYGVETNGATAWEVPSSIDVSAGDLSVDGVLRELDTGLFINNVWYLNYSDRSACRTTGMTRFATFWVENGEIKAPLNVMRFDETFYNLLGENLVGLTKEREMILDSGSWTGRSTKSARMPGALVNDFTLTL